MDRASVTAESYSAALGFQGRQPLEQFVSFGPSRVLLTLRLGDLALQCLELDPPFLHFVRGCLQGGLHLRGERA